MKAIIWSVFAFVALLWTAGAALLSQLIQWSAQGLVAAGGAATAGGALAIPMPPWLAPWLDATAWSTLLQGANEMLTAAAYVLPTASNLVAWLVPAVWVVWALGLATLLGLTLTGIGLMRRYTAPMQGRPRLT